MRRALFVVFLAFAVPSFAAKNVSLEQLEQTLTASAAKPDADRARQIAELQLAYRVSPAEFERLLSRASGTETRRALLALVDQSQFQPLPPSPAAQAAAPDVAEQRRIMGLAVAYVGKTIPQLPNFFATRVTTHFEDTPLLQVPMGSMPYEPIHYLDSSRASVLYREGREVIDNGATNVKKAQSVDPGLTTRGVFGPILGIVLLDAAQNKLAWSRWEESIHSENGPSSRRAVFAFSVPREKSHYEVNFCCVAEEAATVVANLHPFQQMAAYHGELSIEPATGAILRLTVIADMKASEPVVKAAILVDYDEVEIGGRKYTCPMHSVSTTLAQTLQLDPKYKRPLALQMQPLKNSLADTVFTDYHMFRADSRILTAEEPAETTPSASSLPGAPSGSTVSKVEPQLSSSLPREPSVAAAQPSPIPATPPPPAPESEITTSDSADLPAAPATQAGDNGFTVRSTSRLVDVSVVAYDKKGHPVPGLTPDNFAVFDNGVPQKVLFFTQAEGAVALRAVSADAQPAPAEPEPVYANRRKAATPQRTQTDCTVLMIDGANVAWADLSYARQEMLRFLKAVPPSVPVGVYILHGHGFQVLTEPVDDHAKVSDILIHWMPKSQDLLQAQEQEQRNRQQMESVHHASDLGLVNGNVTAGSDEGFLNAVDPQLRSLGDNPQRDVLNNLIWIARHVAAISGHKSLIWVSSDNALADFGDKAPGREKGDKHIDPLALRAREALNDAHVSLYPLDASQLEVGGVGANLQRGNVQVNPTSTDAQFQQSLSQEAKENVAKSQRDINPGRVTAQMQQDTHPIQGTFRELAEATGGRALRRASDIAAELNGIVNDGRAAYQFSFSPQQPADDQYHHITVQVVQHPGISLRFRTGYFYASEPTSPRDKFRLAVWEPQDASEIALTATHENASGHGVLRLNISAPDLAFQTQGGFKTDKLYIFLVARNDSAMRARVTGQTLGMRLRPDTYERTLYDGIPFEQPIDLKPDDDSVRLIVIDANSNRIGSITLPATSLR